MSGVGLFLPVIYRHGWRYRPRLRWRGGWLFARHTQHYPECDVTRLWCGPLLLVVMKRTG